MKIQIVSTFSDKGYDDYGKYFVESCKSFLSKDIEVILYVDNTHIDITANIATLKLEPSIPELTDFKSRNTNKKFKNWRWDAVRFAHKAYAIVHAVKHTNADYLIWLDSDTEIYNHITEEYLLKYIPNDCFVGYIGRDGVSETGFLIFNLKNIYAKEFFDRYEWYYNSDELYNLKEYHDAFIFDVVRKEFELKGKIKSHNISPPSVRKNHFFYAFEGYMIHYKGDEKSQRDLKIKKLLKREK